MGQCPAEDVRQRAERVLPFLLRYSELARENLACVTNRTTALFRLEYVVCSITLTLAREGFCQPPDAEESGEGEGDDGMEVQADDTGLGVGSGGENVSKEIQDESQDLRLPHPTVVLTPRLQAQTSVRGHRSAMLASTHQAVSRSVSVRYTPREVPNC